ncbi:branched-chain amino acid ABC transporter permease [Pokkaliibacter plantistimulans]|uniref:Autoinducer 2 import system permease protein LsrD n=1 Tax=Proteobacteria bacterium 228 TaxID=2083153 RepID=A0A2S5KTQ3_9PROT|nr:ABC transporter permease [Pokkaliibacter plantistimulans]PPC78247.1 branched-chain amino acid ABC transporter permease [Pokkaliibacter plantistimulans]
MAKVLSSTALSDNETAMPAASASLLQRLACWESFLLLVTVAVFFINAAASPYFLDVWNLSDATFNFTEKAIIVLPMAMLIIAREIDLSVASIIALSSTLMGFCAQQGMATPALVAVGLASGLACGLLNGLLVTRFGLSSIVVTIGTMSLFRGITYILLGDQVLNQYPASFAYFGQGYVYWVFSFEFVLFLGLALLFYIALHRTNFGRRTYAIGNNPVAAYYSGINVNHHKLVLFVLVGVLSGLASILLTSRLGSTRPTIALGWELGVVTMAVLGGVNILGGAGSISGVVIAAFLMGLVTFGLGLLNVPGIVMSIIIGVMLIVVISLPIISKRLLAKRQGGAG